MSETVDSALRRFSDRLNDGGIESARLDARLLLAAAMAKEPQSILLHSGEPVTAIEFEHARSFVRRRLAGEPVSRILGYREFWGLQFKVGPSTLDPRPDSETVISAALSLLPRNFDSPLSILDLGTGTGCLLLALISEIPNALGVGVDRDAAAVDIAQQNASALYVQNRVTFYVGDWAEALNAEFDLIICNPPYISRGDLPKLQTEVSDFDPIMALDGGEDGLDGYRRLLPQCYARLVSGGLLILELGVGQLEAVTQLAEDAGLKQAQSHNDLSGIPRCLSCLKP